jgi:hypothetical protein
MQEFNYSENGKKFDVLKTLSEGIWYIKEIDCGKHYRFLTDKITDLPQAITTASILPYLNEISNEITEYLEVVKEEAEDFTLIKTTDILKIIVRVIEKHKDEK